MAALGLGQGATLAVDTTLRGRVAMAFYFVARTVFAESTGTTGHEQRERLARSIAFQDAAAFQTYTALVVTDPAIIAAGPATQAAITDGQIVDAVTAMWNTLAGVPA